MSVPPEIQRKILSNPVLTATAVGCGLYYLYTKNKELELKKLEMRSNAFLKMAEVYPQEDSKKYAVKEAIRALEGVPTETWKGYESSLQQAHKGVIEEKGKKEGPKPS